MNGRYFVLCSYFCLAIAVPGIAVAQKGEGLSVKKSSSDPKQLKPVECVVIANNDKVVMFIAGAKKEDAAETAIKELVASWKWKK